MAQAEKRLEQMRRNPAGDWRIADVQAVCRWAGVECSNPSGGSHYTIAHSSQREILTIPAHRPIKAPYIRALVRFIDAVRRTET